MEGLIFAMFEVYVPSFPQSKLRKPLTSVVSVNENGISLNKIVSRSPHLN